MTFTATAQSVTDNNNSSTSITSSYTGVFTSTNGYESINVNIVCDIGTTANGLKIQFSSDGSTVSKTISDTFFANINFSKNYQVLDKYYRVNITNSSAPSTRIITSRLLVSTTSTEVVQNTFYDSNQSIIDAFGKLRVSNPFTLLDMKFPVAPPSGTPTTEYLNNSELTCTYSSAPANYLQTTTGNGYRTIYVNNKAAGIFQSQSRKYCTNLPGKSMLVLCSGIMDAGNVTTGILSNNSNNLISRIGYFDDYNGFYFEYTADGLGTGSCTVFLKSNNTVIEQVSQSNWNIDPMNGSGTSTLNLDFTKAQLFVIDFEWLGVGRIRYGFYAFGKINYCHQITNINSLASGPYIPSANLPIRYELQGPSVAGNTGAMIQICSTVISEGGYNPQGRPFTANNGLPSSNNVTSAETPLLAIRGSDTRYYHQNIIPLGVQIINTANTTSAIIYRIRYYLSPSTPPATFTWNNVDNYSVMQYSTGSFAGFTTTGSIIVEEGYFSTRGTSEFNGLSDVFSNVVQITSDISNVSDIILITAQIQTGNAQVACSIQWQEIY